MDLASAAKIATIVTPIVIAGGFGFAYRQWQSIRNTRMAEILVSLGKQWDSPEMQDSRCLVNQCGKNLKQEIKKADTENSPDLYRLVKVANFFDFLGGMVMAGYFDVRTAYDVFWRTEEHYYELYRLILDDPDYKDYIQCFQKLHQAFATEKAKRIKEKPRPSV